MQIEANPRSGLPRALCERGLWREITRIQDIWHVDDEWWREPINRRYLAVVLSDGTLRTIFHDRVSDRWFAQSY
ncbi:MAG: hypothetical protein U0031_07555 [Thermomicrobiales bacterium]